MQLVLFTEPSCDRIYKVIARHADVMLTKDHHAITWNSLIEFDWNSFILVQNHTCTIPKIQKAIQYTTQNSIILDVTECDHSKSQLLTTVIH